MVQTSAATGKQATDRARCSEVASGHSPVTLAMLLSSLLTSLVGFNFAIAISIPGSSPPDPACLQKCQDDYDKCVDTVRTNNGIFAFVKSLNWYVHVYQISLVPQRPTNLVD